MYPSQGSSKDLFLRTNSQMDSFAGSLSQDWSNSLSQDSRPITVPCTPSNIFGFPGSAESISQPSLPPHKWSSQTNFGTPTYQGKDLRESQLISKIWFGLTAVFKIVSQLPEKLSANNNKHLQNDKKDIQSVVDEFSKLFLARSDSDLQAMKTQHVENAALFQRMYTMLDMLNKKLGESQALFETFEKSFQEDISKKNGILFRKLSTRIRDIQTWITDFQKVQNHNLSMKYEEILDSKKDILAAISELNNKFDTKFDTLTSQFKNMQRTVDTLCDASIRQNTVKQSPVARVLPLHSKSVAWPSATSNISSQQTKRSLGVGTCFTQHTKESPVKKTKGSNMWCVLTPEWNCFNEEAIYLRRKQPLHHLETKTNVSLCKPELSRSDTSFENECDHGRQNTQQESSNQNKYFALSRPISRFSYTSSVFPRRLHQ